MNITKKITFGATAAAALSSALRGRLWRRTIRATARRGRTHTTRIPRPPPGIAPDVTLLDGDNLTELANALNSGIGTGHAEQHREALVPGTLRQLPQHEDPSSPHCGVVCVRGQSGWAGWRLGGFRCSLWREFRHHFCGKTVVLRFADDRDRGHTPPCQRYCCPSGRGWGGGALGGMPPAHRCSVHRCSGAGASSWPKGHKPPRSATAVPVLHIFPGSAGPPKATPPPR